MQWQLIQEPRITDALLTNPDMGFIAAPGLQGSGDDLRDNRGQRVAAYRFAPEAKTWNHPDSAVSFASAPWRVLEPQEGVYDWSPLDDRLDKARALGCTAVVRCQPYSLTEDVPSWLRARWPEEPEFPFWQVDPNTTDYAACWARFIRAFAARYDGHPVISSVDMALVGAWGEGGGSEFVAPERLDEIIRAYVEGFPTTPLQCLLHDPVSVGAIRRYRRPVGFRVDCLGDMGGFHGDAWSHMQDFYPQNIENFAMHDAWQSGPVLFEACWHMNDWYLSGWDIDYIISESLKWHISSFNSKGTTVPEAWRDRVAAWVRRMGYRFELRRVRATCEGRRLVAELLWCNTGVAPCYRAFPLVLRLKGQGREIVLTLPDDLRAWLPDEDQLCRCDFPLPEDLPAGMYDLAVAIQAPLEEIGTLNLAIEGRMPDGFYLLGQVSVQEG